MSTFYAIDFDRTLGNVEGQTALLSHFLEQQNLLWPEEVTAKIEAAHQEGTSFDVISYVHATHPAASIEKIRRDYMALALDHTDELVLPGADTLIAWLDQRGLPFGIVSYGEPAWQEFKIEAAGFGTLPHLIVPTRDKSKLFRTWWRDDAFWLPAELGGGRYESIVLVDDRLGAFDDKPDSVRGYWIAGEQAGEVPTGVVRVNSVVEVSGFEKEFLAKP